MGTGINPNRKHTGVGTIILSVAICIVLSGVSAYFGTQFAYGKNGERITENSDDKESFSAPTIYFSDIPQTDIVTASLRSELTSIETTNKSALKTAGTYAEVAKTVTPTVVEISTESLVTVRGPLGGSYIIVNHFDALDMIYADYQRDTQQLKSYMERQWNFIGRMAGKFSEMII